MELVLAELVLVLSRDINSRFSRGDYDPCSGSNESVLFVFGVGNNDR